MSMVLSPIKQLAVTSHIHLKYDIQAIIAVSLKAIFMHTQYELVPML